MIGAEHMRGVAMKELDATEMDNIVHSVVRECDYITREDLAIQVVDHIRNHISQYILPPIRRLVSQKRIIEDQDASRGRPYIYYVPQKTLRV